ncbi:MAG: hypothetical protein WB646_14485 [Steroidobacteraceae bacterium]
MVDRQRQPGEHKPPQAADSTADRHSREGRAARVRSFDRNTMAELIIDTMARRQGHRSGPYFDWGLATEQFRSSFDAAWAVAPTAVTREAIEQLAKKFVDAWPDGAAALRVIPDHLDPIANPPYSRDGMWPAFLRRRE